MKSSNRKHYILGLLIVLLIAKFQISALSGLPNNVSKAYTNNIINKNHQKKQLNAFFQYKKTTSYHRDSIIAKKRLWRDRLNNIKQFCFQGLAYLLGFVIVLKLIVLIWRVLTRQGSIIPVLQNAALLFKAYTLIANTIMYLSGHINMPNILLKISQPYLDLLIKSEELLTKKVIMYLPEQFQSSSLPSFLAYIVIQAVCAITIYFNEITEVDKHTGWRFVPDPPFATTSRNSLISEYHLSPSPLDFTMKRVKYPTPRFYSELFGSHIRKLILRTLGYLTIWWVSHMYIGIALSWLIILALYYKLIGTNHIKNIHLPRFNNIEVQESSWKDIIYQLGIHIIGMHPQSIADPVLARWVIQWARLIYLPMSKLVKLLF